MKPWPRDLQKYVTSPVWVPSLILSQTEAVLALRGSRVLTRLESSRLAFESEQEMHRDRLLFEMPGPGMSRERGGEEVGEMYTLGTNIPGPWCCVAAIVTTRSSFANGCHFPTMQVLLQLSDHCSCIGR